MKKSLIFLLIVLIISLILPACGGGDKTLTQKPTTVFTDTPIPSPTPTPTPTVTPSVPATTASHTPQLKTPEPVSVLQWSRTYGIQEENEGYSVSQTSDEGYIVAGITRSTNTEDGDVYIIKTDNNGEDQWMRTFGGQGDNEGHSIKQTSDGGYIITGYTTKLYNPSEREVYLIKTDNNGQQLWVRIFGGPDMTSEGHSVQQTSDGGYIIVGCTGSSDNKDVYLIKTNNNGEELWVRTFGGQGYDEGYSIQQTSDKGYVIVGYTTRLSSSNREVYFIKIDKNGQQLWARTFGGPDMTSEGRSVQQTSDGGYIIIGYIGSSDNKDVYIIKTNSNGEEQWVRNFSGQGDAEGYSGQQDNDGGYIIAGYTGYHGSSNREVYLIKTDSNGQQMWSRTFGGSYCDEGRSVQQTRDGGYIVAGITHSHGPAHGDVEPWNVYLIKTDADGNTSMP